MTDGKAFTIFTFLKLKVSKSVVEINSSYKKNIAKHCRSEDTECGI